MAGGSISHEVLCITFDRQGHMEGGLHDWTKDGMHCNPTSGRQFRD